MRKVCQNRNMQIAARNGNLKIAGADEGRNMLINELKSDCISQVVAPQGKAHRKKAKWGFFKW